MPRVLAVTIGLALLVAAAGCGDKRPPLSDQCTASTDVIEHALARAPAPVRLSDGTPLSRCIHDADDDAELQNVGITFSQAAERLRVRAQAGDAAAADAVGYVVGAVRRGSDGTAGVAAELVRRIELVAGRLEDDVPALRARVEHGVRAVEATG